MQPQPPHAPRFCPSCGSRNEMQAGFCYSCGSSLPALPPLPTSTKKPTSAPILFGIGLLIGLFVLGIFLIAYRSVSRLASRASPNRSPSPVADLSLVPKATPVVHSAPQPPWRYVNGMDDMSGKESRTATVTSSNTVSFDSPYQGAQHGTLTLRKHPRWGNNVMIEIERGQFMSRVTGVQVLARFDDGGPVKFWASGPEDHSTTILFINDYRRFVGQLRKAKTVRLSTSVYRQGAPVFEFDVAGLEGF